MKPGFFCNSGIKIDGKTEAQIFDTPSLRQAIDNGPQAAGVEVIVDGTEKTIWADYQLDAQGVEQKVFLKESKDGAPSGAKMEEISALINGAAYGVPGAIDQNGKPICR